MMRAMTKPVEKSFAGLGGTNIVYDLYEPDGRAVGLILVAHGVAEHARPLSRTSPTCWSASASGSRSPTTAATARSGRQAAAAPRDLSEFTADLETLRRLEAGRRAGRRTSSATAWAARSPSTTRSTTRTCSPH